MAPLGPTRLVEIADRYLDTADGALRGRGLVARIRTGAGRPRLTVKSLVRAGGGAVHRRLELEGDAGDASDAGAAAAAAVAADPATWPPSRARAVVLDAAGGRQLVTLAVLHQRRRQRDVRAGASVIELSLDDIEVDRPDGTHDRWTELEAELRSGREADLIALGTILLQRAGLAAATASKLDRALGR